MPSHWAARLGYRAYRWPFVFAFQKENTHTQSGQSPYSNTYLWGWGRLQSKGAHFQNLCPLYHLMCPPPPRGEARDIKPICAPKGIRTRCCLEVKSSAGRLQREGMALQGEVGTLKGQTPSCHQSAAGTLSRSDLTRIYWVLTAACQQRTPS